MVFATSVPSSRSDFEQFLLETFGIYTNVSTEATIAFAAALIIATPFVVNYLSEKTVR